MNIAFRVDASAEIGSGHLMRCLALADTLREQGAITMFITRAEKQPWRELLRQHGHAIAALPGDPVTQTQDAAMTRAALAKMASPDWLVVDHYSLGKEWESAIRSSCERIFAIDDIGRPHDCDLLLDQNAVDDKHAYQDLLPINCRRLLGPRYALLRPDFGKESKNCSVLDKPVKRILINFGGSDPTQEIYKSIEAFLASRFDSSVCADVVLGSANLCAEIILKRHSENPRLNLITHTDNMAVTMAGADMAIGAGGVSMWERACLGIPSIVVVTAENQKRGAEWLAAQGGHLLLGKSKDISSRDIAEALNLLAGNFQLRSLFNRTSTSLGDGHGCERVARALLGSRVVLRPVTTDDCGAIYAWRNAEINRRYSGDENSFSFETHQLWFDRAINNPLKILLIGEDNHGPTGVLRFDLEGTEAVISVYLVPGRHGMGLGTALLEGGANWLSEHRPDISTIRARVKTDNLASISAFKHAGFVEQERTFILSLHNRNAP